MKRNKILRLIPFFGLVFLSLTCEKDEAKVAPKVNSQEVLFEVSYINFAWGEQASVLYVKSDGLVIFHKGKPKYNIEDLKGQLSEVQIKENLALASTTKKQIATTELGKYSNLITDLKAESFSKKIQRGADMGAYTYTAYQFNESEKVYKAIKLAEEGDWVSYNLDPNAKLITEWLKSIQAEVYMK